MKDFDHNIIVRFLMNETSKEETQLLKEWIWSDLNNKKYFEKTRDTWNCIELEDELDNEKVSEDLAHVLGQIEEKRTSRTGFKLKSLLDNWAFKSAAIFIFGIGAMWMGYIIQESGKHSKEALTSIETPKGSTTIVNLSDGSKIWLNADSKLTYPQQFSENERSVFLEGEAFFEIAKDHKRQFLVKTSDLVVKVFGTSFNVKSYPGEKTTETTLVEGSISLYKSSTNGKVIGNEIKMEPNQRIVLFKEQEKSTRQETKPKKIAKIPDLKAKLEITKQVDPERFISWKRGQLIIESEPMIKLASVLERRYNVNIHFDTEEAKQYRFTGTIENETIEQVMAVLKLASPIDYTIEDREIWISELKKN